MKKNDFKRFVEILEKLPDCDGVSLPEKHEINQPFDESRTDEGDSNIPTLY